MIKSALKTNLKYLTFLHKKAYINGEWVHANSKKTFKVINPANLMEISLVPDMNLPDVQEAIKAAHTAFPAWSSLTAKERGSVLKKLCNLLLQNIDEFAKILTLESGKPIAEAKQEILYSSSFFEWFAEEARRIYGDIFQSPFQSSEVITIKQPIGVAALITPWNFPLSSITKKVGAALAAGCTCIVKPSEHTPLSALALCDLVTQAGVPNGVINVVTCSHFNAPAICKEFCQNPSVAGLSFTGSTSIGKLLYEQCASSIKRLSLELGGNAPFIVFNNANINKAIDGAIQSKFRNNGQACVSVNRFLIQEGIFDLFVYKLEKRMLDLKLGNGMDEGVNQGPLINLNHIATIENIVKDATDKGAKVILGGERAREIGEQFYKPTLLTNIQPNMLCYNEEIFGPVAVCIKFSSESEAIEISNNTKFGLAGYFYSNDLSQIWRVAKNLHVGMVGVNESLISTAEAPFGGIKESGIGREGSYHGIEEFVFTKCICLGNLQ
ncbi:succinate-semialdehyde dehydrogenase, mitochondrial-like [Lycorma delicatula]|uniref:succinate-semialdehyde dehydrogenase, mitochondrial-like n=1 Tax=Lycorma delicatula TaxID=130591 RepID=UPI003F519138